MVSYINRVANTYTSSTPSQTLLNMKDVFDAINSTESSKKVLWNKPSSGSAITLSLPISSFFGLVSNPFQKVTEIRFLSKVKEPVFLNVYDLSGNKVRDLVKNINSTLYWDGTDNNGKKLSYGVYLVRMENSSERATVKAIINR